MKTKSIIYNKVFSLGNYENEKIGVEIEIEPGDSEQTAIQKARQFVEYNHNLNGFTREIDQCEHIVQNPDDFTGSQVKRARERINELNEVINNGQKLLFE